MRRATIAVVAGLALALAAGCGDDDDGGDNGEASPPPAAATTPPAAGDNTEQVCAAGQELFNELDTEGSAVRDALIAAGESGDPAELEQARSDYLEFVGGFVDEMREIGGTADDPELESAIETFADEFQAVADQAAENPTEIESVDTSALQSATAELGVYCE